MGTGVINKKTPRSEGTKKVNKVRKLLRFAAFKLDIFSTCKNHKKSGEALFVVVLTFLIITSLIKNESRLLEKKIINLNIKILSKEKNVNEAQLDFHYLSSPAKIETKLSLIENNNYKPIEHSKIFLNISDFTFYQNKFSTLNNLNEKENQKKQ